MDFKKIWQLFAGRDDIKTTLHSLVGTNERPGETEEERQRRHDEEGAAAARTSAGVFGGGS